MTLRPDLVLLPLDDDIVVFSEETQCLVGLNASAAFMVRKLQDGTLASDLVQALASEGLAAPEEAARWVTTTLDALGSHGMLADSRAPKTPSPGTRSEEQEFAVLAATMPPYMPFEPMAERRYRLLDTCVVIRFAMFSQVLLVDSVIGHLATDNFSAPTMVVDIQGVKLEHNQLRSDVYRDGKPAGYLRRATEP
jgi:hypothetical protein